MTASLGFTPLCINVFEDKWYPCMSIQLFRLDGIMGTRQGMIEIVHPFNLRASIVVKYVVRLKK